MKPDSRISQHWQQPNEHGAYATGVSLHSHTSLSVETLSFIHDLCSAVPLVRPIIDFYGRRSSRNRNLPLDFHAANWRPPLVPRMAYDVEARQIHALGLHALVSITDHDDLQAPLLLRNLPSARGIPMSLEWSVPYGQTCFHLGIHNLPSAEASVWMERFKTFTAAPDEQTLLQIFEELDSIAQVLVVLNHPQWDLHKIGAGEHARELDRFLRAHNHVLHALELNGLRHSRENRQVVLLAERWNQLLISGGDRHGLEPNANINLTDAMNFTQFVHEIRVHRVSHVLFMNQYARPWEQRILESTLEAVTDHPSFSPGWQRWDERAFHPDVHGTMRPLAELWTGGRAPLPLRVAIQAIRFCGHRSLSGTLSLALTRGGSAEAKDVLRKTA